MTGRKRVGALEGRIMGDRKERMMEKAVMAIIHTESKAIPRCRIRACGLSHDKLVERESII